MMVKIVLDGRVNNPHSSNLVFTIILIFCIFISRIDSSLKLKFVDLLNNNMNVGIVTCSET